MSFYCAVLIFYCVFFLIRGEDEYKNLEAQMLAKGLRAPISAGQSGIGGPGHTPGVQSTRPPSFTQRKNSY